MRGFQHRRWHLDERYVKINSEMGNVQLRRTWFVIARGRQKRSPSSLFAEVTKETKVDKRVTY